MKELKYNENLNPIICMHEENMNKRYKEIIKTYEPKFAEKGISLVYHMGWNNFLKNENSDKRLLFTNGYNCYFSVGTRKNGKTFCYNEEEGATLGANFCISSISKFFFHLNVYLYEDTSDVIKEMNRLLEIVSSL